MKPWRVQGSHGEADVSKLGTFDELVVGNWLHVEIMDTRVAWIRIGTRVFNVRIGRDDSVKITSEDLP